MIVPPTRVTLVAPNAIARSMRPPYRMRDSRSRPNWSVPSRWPEVPGAAIGCSASMAVGDWVARTGARSTARITMPSMTRPTISVSRRRVTLRRRPAALVAARISSSDGLAAHAVLTRYPRSCADRLSDAGVEGGLDDVGQQVDDHDQHREQQRHA